MELLRSGQIPAEKIDTAVHEVLAHDDFGKERTVTYWLPKDATDSPNMPAIRIGDMFAAFFEVLMWVTIALLISWAIYWFIANPDRWRWYFQGRRDVKETRTTPLPRVLQEDVVRRLPANVPDKVRRLWEAGDKTGALSLLYRGAVAQLIASFGLRIGTDATEGDCLSAASDLNISVREYFTNVTRTWQRIAYANVEPTTSAVSDLCELWAQHFEGPQ